MIGATMFRTDVDVSASAAFRLVVQVGIVCGSEPVSGRLVVELRSDAVEVVCLESFGRVDFSPALAWAASCRLDGCPVPPDGWRFEGVERLPSLEDVCRAV